MKLLLSSLIIVLSTSLFTACSQEEDATSLALLTEAVPAESNFDANMQLGEKDRIVQAEAQFLSSIKSALKLDDKIGFKQLYFLENANPEYVAMIDYIYDKKWHKYFNDLHISIEVNQKAQQHNIYFTTPYLGDLVILLQNKYGKSQTKIPVGIKDGRYYFTLGAKR